LLRPLADKKGLSLTFEGSKSGFAVWADTKRFHQILVNLVGNAIKFTDSGAIRIGMSTVSDDVVKITVTDQGIGINAEHLDLLFQPFVQVDGRLSRKYEGTGLGLALTKSLVDAHGGRISVESVPGEGSCFSVFLPSAAAHA
jgi:signal transduction histidine kinase